MAADDCIDGSLAFSVIYSLVLIDGQTWSQGWTPPDGVAVSFHDGRLDITAAVPEPQRG